jgi:PAS domain-containing protein
VGYVPIRPIGDGGWVATHQDITEQHRGELALAEARVRAERAQQDAQAAHARLVEAFEVVPEGVVLTDSDDRLVLWNSQYAETYCAPADAIAAGMRFEDILRSDLARGDMSARRGVAGRGLPATLPSNRQEQLLSSGHRRRAPDRERRKHRRSHRRHRDEATRRIVSLAVQEQSDADGSSSWRR